VTDTMFFTDVLTQDHTHNTDTKKSVRNITFDFIRGLAVFFMVFVHVLGVYASYPVQDSVFGYVVDFLGSPPAAPVFMFSMGIFFVLSSKSDSLKDGVIRGLKLLALGSLLSFLRYDLLILFENWIWGGESLDIATMTAIWEVDILQFAGCAYIFMSLIKRYLKKPVWWLIIAVVIMIISPYTWGISSENTVINWLLHFLWGAGEDVYFPIFGWLYYPLIGMIFGLCMKSCSSIKSLMQSSLKIGLILLAIGSAITVTNFDYHIGDYYKSGPGSMIWIMGFVLVWLWLCNIITERAHNNKLVETISFWGRETTSIYFIHWIILMWGTLILGSESYGPIGTILLTAMYIALSHGLTILYKKRKIAFQ